MALSVTAAQADDAPLRHRQAGNAERVHEDEVGQRDETISEEILQGLSPEFYMQIEWLPGGRFEDGELMFDPIFDELEKRPDDRGLSLYLYRV